MMLEEHSREPWSHEAQAAWDQFHANAMEKLRGADTFVLAYMKSTDPVDVGIVTSTCVAGQFVVFLLQKLAEQMPRMLEETEE